MIISKNQDMIVTLFLCIIKLVEFSTMNKLQNNKNIRKNKKYKRKNTDDRKMSYDIRVLRTTPDSDCNSNLKTSCISTTSSQDVDFVGQDNSDYQWFLDYDGYRDESTNHHNHHTNSILFLPETYEASDNYFYETLAKNMDANLAEADMESFKTEDIRTLLTNLPPICSDHQLSQENNRQGECYADVSGSLMSKFDLDSFIHSSQYNSQGEEDGSIENSNSMSLICKSELLFSPLKEENPVPGVNYFSVDSLDSADLRDMMMLTCKANKNNYTIAFEGSGVTIYSEDDSDYHETTDNSNSTNPNEQINKKIQNKNYLRTKDMIEGSMTQSDTSNHLTTWSKLKKQTSENHLITRRPSSGNNNNSEDETSHNNLISSDETATSGALKSQSMPNLYKKKLRGLINKEKNSDNTSSVTSTDTTAVPTQPVKLFDIHNQQQYQNSSCSASTSDMISEPPNFSLVKLFMKKQKSTSLEGMSMTMDQQLSSAENWPASSEGGSAFSDVQKTSKSSNDNNIECGSMKRTCGIHALNETNENPSTRDFNNKNDKTSGNNNDSFRIEKRLTKNGHNMLDQSIQTSQFSEIINLKNAIKYPSKMSTKQPVKLIESTSFLNTLLKKEKEGEIYVLYPNYVLPNLDFLNTKNKDISKINFIPQKVVAPQILNARKKRPYSFNDIEMLKKKGFNHIKDWDSLNFLLPQEYKRILSTDSSSDQSGVASDQLKVKQQSFMRLKNRPNSMTDVSSCNSTSTGTQPPSSGYRGSSTYSTTSTVDSQNSSDKQQTTTPTSSTSKGILKKDNSKRYSLVETNKFTTAEELAACKRKSMPEPYYFNLLEPTTEDDEGVDAGTSGSSLEERYDTLQTNHLYTDDELLQLEEFLKQSELFASEDDSEEKQLEDLRLKSYVTQFLSLKINNQESRQLDKKKKKILTNLSGKRFTLTNNNLTAPTTTATFVQQTAQKTAIDMMPISEEENENSPNYFNSPQHKTSLVYSYFVQKKELLINAVLDAVNLIVHHFSSASNQQELNALGDSKVNPACAKLILTTLCPALYALLSDGLKPCLETSFGTINNSVWQVVEGSAQQGLLITKALNDLVMKINSEDVISGEGLLKFNSFIFGLLNLRSLDAWLSYLRTRTESVLKKHYTSDSLLLVLSVPIAGANLKCMLDKMIAAIQPLAFLPFQCDLLFEYKQLHFSFKRRMDSSNQYQLNNSAAASVIKNSVDLIYLPENVDKLKLTKTSKERPKSCMEVNGLNFILGEDVHKKWVREKMGCDKRLILNEEDCEVDSLEPPKTAPIPSTNKEFQFPIAEDNDRFKKLQQKWEMLSGRIEKESSNPTSPTHTNKSKIPRPITSPIKPLIGAMVCAPIKQMPSKIPISPQGSKGIDNVTVRRTRVIARSSRLDQQDNSHDMINKHNQRPSSMPCKPGSGTALNQQQNTKIFRRAVSASLNRKRPVSDGGGTTKNTVTTKIVKTVNHQRAPPENGHLSYTKGERLKVILEVDDKWLLCCKGTKKGLVLRSAVTAAENDQQF